MDAVRANRMAKELAGKAVSGWRVRQLIDNGKSALVLEAERDGQLAALKVYDPELVDASGKESVLERIAREVGLIGHDHPESRADP